MGADHSRSMLSEQCKILRALCSVFLKLKLESSLTTAFGTLQIMVGLFNMGLGAGRTSLAPGDFASLGAAYWLGAVFIVTGILSILAGHFPARVLVGFTVFMNIAAAIFAITGIVLYVIDLQNSSLLWLCDRSRITTDHFDDDSCRSVALQAQILLMSMDFTMITLALPQLLVSVVLSIVGIKTLIIGTRMAEDKEEDQLQ